MTATAPAYSNAPRARLRESPLNPRKQFDQAKLVELARSERASGILTPLLVRENRRLGTYQGEPVLEIASGHRRFRASDNIKDGKEILVALAEVPVIVRDLDDATFLEILTIDNLQRDDLHPLEEAEGYKAILALDGYDIGKLAGKVGKSESYIYDRIKLLQLIPAAQKLFLKNRFSAGHAILLARLRPEDQKRCIAVDDDGGYTRSSTGGMWRAETSDAEPLGLEDPSGIEGEWDHFAPVSVRELQDWINSYVRFDESDAVQLAHVLPETAEKVRAAVAEQQKVLKISRDHHVQPDAKAEGERTYSRKSWKRADGKPDLDPYTDEPEKKASKPCDYARPALIVAGPGRGESLDVCVEKKKCRTHWAAEIDERNKRERAKSSGADGKPGEESWERDRRLRKERTERLEQRWKKGGAAVLAAIAAKLKKTLMTSSGPAGQYIAALLGEGFYGLNDRAKEATKLGIGRGLNPGDFMRHVIMASLIDVAEPTEWDDSEKALQKDLDALKIRVNVKQLLDAANPEPKKEKAAAPAKAKKAK